MFIRDAAIVRDPVERGPVSSGPRSGEHAAELAAELAGSEVGELGSVCWRAARYRDLLRYSWESRLRLAGLVLAGLSAALALVKEIAGSLGERSSAVVVIFIVAASATFGKEAVD